MTIDDPKSLYEKINNSESSIAIQNIVDQENSKRIRVHMPAKVVAVHETTVDIEIQGQEDSGYGYYTGFAPLLNIPILYNNYTTKAYLITPIQVGDTGLVEFLDFNSSAFTADGNAQMTYDQIPHSLNNGIYINGYIPNTKVHQVAYKDNNFISKDNNQDTNAKMIVPPTVEVWDRERVQNEDGSYSTTVSTDVIVSEDEYSKLGLKASDLGENQAFLAIIPSVYDGKTYYTTDEEGNKIIDIETVAEHFYQTGEHLGIFIINITKDETTQEIEPTAESLAVTEAYSVGLHDKQAEYIDGLDNAISMGLHNKTFSMVVDDLGKVTLTSQSQINIKGGLEITLESSNIVLDGDVTINNGASGSFTTSTGKTVTVNNGIIVGIE